MTATAPSFLVIGAGRSGTTGLVEGLRTHPGVFVTEPKEPHYFGLHGTKAAFRGPGDDATINRVSVTDRAGYLALYPSVHDYAALGDGSVSTLYYHEHAIPEIAAMNPAMRIVVLLRDPVARAHSSFHYMRARGFEPEDSFLAAVADEERRRAENWHHLWHYTHMSRYATALAAFFESFGRDQVRVWYYDDLSADYVGTVREVLRFIGAPVVQGEAEGVPRVNISGTPRSALTQKMIWGATRNETLRRTVKRLTSYRLRERVRRATLSKTSLDEATRAELEPRFADDLGQLAGLLDQDGQPPWLSSHRPTAGAAELGDA